MEIQYLSNCEKTRRQVFYDWFSTGFLHVTNITYPVMTENLSKRSKFFVQSLPWTYMLLLETKESSLDNQKSVYK